ncbi:unnamed protein product [Rotaria magnacalcarata]
MEIIRKQNGLFEIAKNHSKSFQTICKISMLSFNMEVVTMCQSRVVDYAKVKKFTDSLIIPYIETSAKDSNNVELAFKDMVASIMSSMLSSKSENANINVSSKEKCQVVVFVNHDKTFTVIYCYIAFFSLFNL